MKNRIIYIIGVSGSGKTTIGELLSKKTGIPFFDGDDFHPESNIQKMKSGQPLDDDDRQGWLEAINQLVVEQSDKSGAIVACSALKGIYRGTLEKNLAAPPIWVFLEGSFDLILNRMKERSHFMPPELLKSQFDTLEIPENAIRLDISLSPSEIIKKIIVTTKFMASEFGLVGLGVMGKSLALNLAENGVVLSLFNRHESGIEEDVAKNFVGSHALLDHAKGFGQLPEFIRSLQQPRKIFLMVPSGAVDQVINQLIPLMDEGDLIIDGGNAHYKETKQRAQYLAQSNIHFLGTGVSGGEKGARTGPSIMPGGTSEAYAIAKDYLTKIAAKDKEGKPCCTYIGPEGAGHFVKMVHNGIEYSEMQLLAEAYLIFRQGMNYSPDQIADVFDGWANSNLSSYLLEITAAILRKQENADWLIDKILDKAGNKGTGGWTIAAATELGVPIPMISAALFARYLSSFKEERVGAEQLYRQSDYPKALINLSVNEIKAAYELARIINHHQGFHMLSSASSAYRWQLDLAEIARIWTNGCIIRSTLMELLSRQIKDVERILDHPAIVRTGMELKTGLQRSVAESIGSIPIPCFAAAQNYFSGYTQALSSANILQAQRDFFGAHQYQRNDDQSGKFYHTEWE